jgi:hypothetical protein
MPCCHESKRVSYVAPQDQVVHNAHNPAHRIRELTFGVAGSNEVDALAIMKQTTREKLVVDVQRCCTQVV